VGSEIVVKTNAELVEMSLNRTSRTFDINIVHAFCGTRTKPAGPRQGRRPDHRHLTPGLLGKAILSAVLPPGHPRAHVPAGARCRGLLHV
jgi:hypothetical protein